MNFIIEFIRKNIYLYVIFILIYKKFTKIFQFIENDQYKFIKHSKIKNVIDAGSNNFQTANLISSHNNVKIFCYDPIKFRNFNINKLKKNIVFNNYALWNKNEKNIFYTPYFKNFELSSLASFYKMHLQKYFKKYKINSKKIRIRKRFVICKKLDNKILNFQFIKIDAECSELGILKGAKKNIKKNNPIILLEKNKDFYLINNFLKKLNYKSYNNYNYNKKKFENVISFKKSDNMFFLNKESFKYLHKH